MAMEAALNQSGNGITLLMTGIFTFISLIKMVKTVPQIISPFATLITLPIITLPTIFLSAVIIPSLTVRFIILLFLVNILVNLT